MLRDKKFILLTILSSLVFLLNAQNTNSPYSRYGYGVLNDQAIGAAKSMGGISYGFRGQNINPGNPASYSAVDSLTFIFDIGVSYTQSRLSDGKYSQSENNGGLDYVSMLFPISKKLGMSIGLLPFSSVGYSFGSNVTENGITSLKSFEGSGGLSQVYGGLAYEPLKSLSLGFNVSYLYGSITHQRSLPQLSGDYVYTSYETNKLSLRTAKFDFGAQYELPLSKNKKIILGAVFTPGSTSKSRIERNYIVVSSQGKESDTTTQYRDKMGLPNSFGVGFTFVNKPKLILGADVTYQQWSKVIYSDNMRDGMDDSNRFNDRWRINTGAEYVINPAERSFVKRIRFRGGLNYSNSYLNVKNIEGQVGGYKEYGATFGLGSPLRDVYTGRTSYINIGFNYTNLQPDNKNMIKEQYFGVSVNMNINDMWFLKNKFR